MYPSLDYHEYIEKILEEHPEIDGIFASSDVIAAQVIQICRKKGIPIPDQIKLVGFDDDPPADSGDGIACGSDDPAGVQQGNGAEQNHSSRVPC